MANHWEVVDLGVNIGTGDITPEMLWQNACRYFQWCDDNPIKAKKSITAGKEVGKEVKVKISRPYTIKGMCLHCNIDERYLKDIRNTKETGSDYFIVVSKLLYIIYVQNVEYAMVGIFNPVFTSKILNLDKEESSPQTIKIEMVAGLPTLSGSELEILEKLEKEKPFQENTED